MFRKPQKISKDLNYYFNTLTLLLIMNEFKMQVTLYLCMFFTLTYILRLVRLMLSYLGHRVITICFVFQSKWERFCFLIGKCCNVGKWGSKSEKRQFKRESVFQKWKGNKTEWVGDERGEGRLQSGGVVQLEGTLRKIETKTKDRS